MGESNVPLVPVVAARMLLMGELPCEVQSALQVARIRKRPEARLTLVDTRYLSTASRQRLNELYMLTFSFDRVVAVLCGRRHELYDLCQALEEQGGVTPELRESLARKARRRIDYYMRP